MKKIIKINETMLKRLMLEAFGNGGFRRFKKSSTSTPGHRKGNLQIDHVRINKAFSQATNTEKEYISVILSHVWKDGVQQLVDAINQSVPKHIMNAAPKNNTVEIRVNIAMKDEVPYYVNKLSDAIKQLNDYSEQSVDNMCVSIYDAIDEVATPDDINNAKEKSISNWQDMLSRLEDPNVRRQLLRYQTTNDYARAYGHVLSPNNVKDVLSQFPTASFVAEASTWKRIFNRTIQPGAQRIVVTKPIPQSNPYSALDNAAIACGYKSFKDAKEQTKNATQVINKIKIMASKKASFFHKVVMYDVSETLPPLDPKLDVWTNQIGLSDNINGVLNDKAQMFDDENQSATKINNQKVISQNQKSKWQNRRIAIEAVCKNYKINVDSLRQLNNDDFIIQASMLFAKQLAPSYGIIHPNQEKQLQAIVAATIALSCDCTIPSSIINICGDKIDKKLGAIAYTIASDVLPQINKYCRATEIQSLT